MRNSPPIPRQTVRLTMSVKPLLNKKLQANKLEEVAQLFYGLILNTLKREHNVITSNISHSITTKQDSTLTKQSINISYNTANDSRATEAIMSIVIKLVQDKYVYNVYLSADLELTQFQTQSIFTYE